MSQTESRPLSVPALERFARDLDVVARRQNVRRLPGGRTLALILALIAVPASAAVATALDDDSSARSDLAQADAAYQSIVADERLTQRCAEILAAGASNGGCERIAADAGTMRAPEGDSGMAAERRYVDPPEGPYEAAGSCPSIADRYASKTGARPDYFIPECPSAAIAEHQLAYDPSEERHLATPCEDALAQGPNPACEELVARLLGGAVSP